MYFELPDCRRCCLCLPLRHGILIFGYLNLMFAIFCLGINIWIEANRARIAQTMFLYKGVGMHARLWVSYVLYTLELIFNIVLLIGAHTKRKRLISAYYYYGISTTLASFLTYLVVVRKVQIESNQPVIVFEPMETCLAISGLVIQCYLLLLIRSELIKLQYQGGSFRFVNHVTEVMVHPLPRGLTRQTVSCNK